MVIGGFQKLSLLDYPGHPAAVVFSQGCLFRCPYCHNPELLDVKSESEISEYEVLKRIEKEKPVIEGVCVTGGEPTLQADLPLFLLKIKEMGLLVKLDTNGSNPRMISDLLEKKRVDYIAMDLKHRWDGYDKVVGTSNHNAIANCRETFRIIQSSGIDHEFRTTIFPGEHKTEDFSEMAGYLKGGEKYFLQDIQFTKNLDPGVSKSGKSNAAKIVSRLKKEFPKLLIEAR